MDVEYEMLVGITFSDALSANKQTIFNWNMYV